MENYYFLEGDHRRGPFSLDQLKTYPIALDTPIWKDGRDEWVPAREVNELKGYLHADESPGERSGEAGRRPFFLFRRRRSMRDDAA